MSDFKSSHPKEKRIEEATRICLKYPDRVPVIVERANKSTIADIDKHKYLVPSDLTIHQFLYVIRKRIKLSEDQALFIFINNTMPSGSELMSNIYKQHQDEDKFLYIQYSGESTFG